MPKYHSIRGSALVIIAIVCATPSAHGEMFWNVFNIEGESSITAAIATYGTLADMVSDSNRTGTFNVGGGFGQNIVGSGASIMSVAIPEPGSAALLSFGMLGLLVLGGRGRISGPLPAFGRSAA